MNIDKNSCLQYIRKALFVITSLSLLPVSYFGVLANGLDESWIFAVNYLSANHKKFGEECFFTYGPLGFLARVRNIEHNVLLGILFWSVIIGIQIYIFYQIYIKNVNIWASIYSMLFILLATPITEADIYLCFLDLLAILMVYLGNYKVRFIVIFLSGMMFLFKFSGEALVAGALVMMGIAVLLKKDKDWMKKAKICVVAILAGPICYLIYHPSIGSLHRYVKAIIEISSGYNLSMSSTGYIGYYFWVLLLAACFIVFLVLCWISDKTNFGILLILSPGCFLWYKEGFVRIDHYQLGFTGMLLICSLLIVFIDWKKIQPVKAAYLSVGVLCSIALLVKGNTISSSLQTMSRNVTAFPLKCADMYYQQKEQLRKDHAEFMNIIGESTYTTFPCDITENAGYGNPNFMIAPLLQNYSAYTPYLDQLNAKFYDGKEAPEYIIFYLKAIDGRLPLIESPETWDSIYKNYRIEQYDGTKFLLKKRDQVLHRKDTLSVIQEFDISDKITVPDECNYAKIKAELNLKGCFELLFYKILPVEMTVEYSDGTSKKGRVIVDNLQEGIDLHSIVWDDADFMNYMDLKAENKQVKRIYFSGERLGQYKKMIEIEFFSGIWE
ncbi:MAG: hypothetical protein K2N87_08430 [Eubacterium sp.]|nr:hypothetical protein [Eubacterium sp.]